MDVIVPFALLIGILFFGFDFLLKSQPWAHKLWRKSLKGTHKHAIAPAGKFAGRQGKRFLGWSWREVKRGAYNIWIRL